MSKLKQLADALDNDEALNNILDKLVKFSVSLFYIWASFYFFLWSK